MGIAVALAAGAPIPAEAGWRRSASWPQLWKTHAALSDLRKAQGRSDEARQAYRDALSVIESVAAALTDESLRETFLSSDHVQGIRRTTGPQV